MRQRDIFLFWLPLFASWLLMTMEGPIISATINRLPYEIVMLAAMGIVTSLSVTIESPIINLLATSTALTKDRPSYVLIRRFTIHWMILLTAVSVLIAFTPLFELIVVKWMAVPREIAAWVKPGLQIMIFWSAAIAWRRFLQGVMIRFNQTRKVAWGTLVRLASSAGSVIIMATATDWPGVIIGSIGLMAGVLAEAGYATWAVRPILKDHLFPGSPAMEGLPLSYRELFWFHLPLAGTSVLILLVQPLVTFSLTRLSRPALSLAAWPIVFQFMLVARAAAFALPEAVIALSDGEKTFKSIRHFTYRLLIINTSVVGLIVLTPLLGVYLYRIQDTTPAVGELASSGLLLFLPLVPIAVLISWIRGLLINNRNTSAINAGMVINLIVTASILAIGVWQSWAGINTAAIALTAAAFVELLYLLWRVLGALDYSFTLIDLGTRVLPK